MREDAERQVATCGVAGEDDFRGGFAEVLERVLEQCDALGQLARVRGCGGEGVGEEEHGGVFAGGVELGDDVGEDGEVLEGRWETVASSCLLFSMPKASSLIRLCGRWTYRGSIG